MKKKTHADSISSQPFFVIFKMSFMLVIQFRLHLIQLLFDAHDEIIDQFFINRSLATSIYRGTLKLIWKAVWTTEIDKHLWPSCSWNSIILLSNISWNEAKITIRNQKSSKKSQNSIYSETCFIVMFDDVCCYRLVFK